MTDRLFIIRGSFILFWFIYDFLSQLFINQRTQLQVNLLFLFGLTSVMVGLWLKLTRESMIKFELALILALIGLALGLNGLYQSWLAVNQVLKSEIYLSFKAATSLFFGSTIVALYGLALKELVSKTFSK